MTTKININDDNNIKFVTDESSPSSTGSMARKDDNFSEIPANLLTRIDLDIGKQKETKRGVHEPPAKKVKVEENEGSRSQKDKIFLCFDCNMTRTYRLHLFECKICGKDNCKYCWPDSKYRRTCARCSETFCRRCNDWNEYYTNGQF